METLRRNKKDSEIEKFRMDNPTIDFITYNFCEDLYETGEWTYENMKNAYKGLAKNKNRIARDLCDRMNWYY